MRADQLQPRQIFWWNGDKLRALAISEPFEKYGATWVDVKVRRAEGKKVHERVLTIRVDANVGLDESSSES
jgi:hypothetical protein